MNEENCNGRKKNRVIDPNTQSFSLSISFPTTFLFFSFSFFLFLNLIGHYITEKLTNICIRESNIKLDICVYQTLH